MRKDFSRLSWLIHYNIIKRLFADINVADKSIKVMIYHLKKKNMWSLQKSSNKKNVKSIFFFFKMLIDAKSKYWSIELKMTALIWIVQRITHMIKLSKYSTVIYIDHKTNSAIATETKFSIINIDKLNLKLIRISIYFFQFRLNIKHRFEKFNVILNALSRLSIAKKKIKNILKINAKNSDFDQIYAHNISLIEMFKNFRKIFMKDYILNSTWKKLKLMLKTLTKRTEKKNSKNIDINFEIKNDLIYHIKDNRQRLCVSFNCKKTVFELTHDQNNHARHHRTYQKFVNSVYMSKMSRKIRQYINYCSSCEFNQMKRHAIYEKLMSIVVSIIFFRIIAMNFIVTFSEQFDSILTMTDKAFKRINIIFEKSTWNASQWTNALLNQLFIADWNFSENIISNRNSKFLSKFWTSMFKKLNTTLFMFTIYHSQTNEQFEKTNQIFEIILKFFITKHSKTNWMAALSVI